MNYQEVKVRRILWLLPVVAVLLNAQEFRGSFSGTVTDAQGAPVPKVRITVTETRTGVKSTAVTEASGAYNVPFLQPGEYAISAEADGFKKAVREGLTLSASEHPVIDFRLEVGAINDAVTVTAEAPLMDTSSPTVGQVLTSSQVEDFPINGRTPMMLDNLALGVVSTFEPGPVRPFDNGAPNSVAIGGAPTGRNEVLLNGAPNAGISNEMAYSPMQDAVSEVRVDTFEMDAAIGHTMGGSINLILKSGTNDLHGSAYIYDQTSVFDANNFFYNRTNTPRPVYHQNQFGGVASGPVYLPKIFNGRNKVFWMFGYEGMRDSDPFNSPVETGNPLTTSSVPTDAERKGDFSALLNVPGSNSYVIYDPRSGSIATGATLVTRTPFPGNVLPTSLLNPVSLKYLQYFPEPNAPGAANGSNNWINHAVDFDNYDNELGHLDINMGEKNRLSFDGRHNSRTQNKNNYFNDPATGNYLYRINQGGGFEDVYTFTPTTVMNVRGNYTRYQEHHFAPADSVSPNDLGFPSYLASNATFQTMPYIVFTSTSSSGGIGNSYMPLGYNGDGTNYLNSASLFGQIQKIHGNHTFKAGADLRLYTYSGTTYGNPSGTFTFCCNSSSTSTSTYMNNPSASTTSSPFGQDMAAFLLGLPSSGSIDNNSQYTGQNYYLGVFVQDDWRVKSNLTINIGLRLDHDYPATEWHNRIINNFDATDPNSITAAAKAAYAAFPTTSNPAALLPASQFNPLGGVVYANTGHPYLFNSPPVRVSPRIGFSWVPPFGDRKTTIRAGFGMFVDNIQLTSMANFQPGFSQQTPMPTTANFLYPPVATLSNPFPNGFLTPVGTANGISTNLGQAIQFYNPNIVNAYSMRWDFSIQRELPGHMVLEAAYVGNRAIHLPINANVDVVPRQYLATSVFRDPTIPGLLTGTVSNPFQGLIPTVSGFNGKTIALSQLLMPFPEYSGITNNQTSAGSSYYESANIRLEKRLTNGLTLIQNFVFSRLLSRVSYLNDTDTRPYQTIDSGSSRPLREVLAATYMLPIGRGRAINPKSAVVNGLVGGWVLSPILTLQSGPPLNWGNYIYMGGPLNLDPSQPNGAAFNTSVFNTVSAQQLANNVRYFANQFNNLRRDYSNEFDLSLIKDFKFTEKGALLRITFEAFNLPNHVTFGNPSTSPTSSGFATITSQANTPRRIETALKLIW